MARGHENNGSHELGIPTMLRCSTIPVLDTETSRLIPGFHNNLKQFFIIKKLIPTTGSQRKCWLGSMQGSRSPDFGAEIGPIPNAKKYAFFPIQQKNSQFETKIFFFFFGSNLYFVYIFTISRNNRIQSQLLLSLPFLIVH